MIDTVNEAAALLARYARLLKNPTEDELAKVSKDEYRQLLKIASPEVAEQLREMRTKLTDAAWRERHREAERQRHREYYRARVASMSAKERTALRERNREAKRRERGSES